MCNRLNSALKNLTIVYVTLKYCPSKEATELNAQQEPQKPWSLIGLT